MARKQRLEQCSVFLSRAVCLAALSLLALAAPGAGGPASSASIGMTEDGAMHLESSDSMAMLVPRRTRMIINFRRVVPA